MNLPKTGFNNESKNHFLLNAGAVVRDLTWNKESNEWEYEEFGATSGGSSLNLENTLRQMEIDGVFATPVGGDQIETSEATIELNLLEFTHKNITNALLASFEASDGTTYPEGYDVIKPDTRVSEDHYIRNLAYVGTYGNHELPIIVLFDYAICTSGLSFESQDNNDNTMSMTFSGRMDPEKFDDASMPVTILLPRPEQPVEV